MLEGILSLFFLFFLLAGGLWVGVSLAVTGTVSMLVFSNLPVGKILAVQLFNWNNNFVMVALPLFIFMGQLLFYSKLNQQLFRGLTPWLSHIPGKLVQVNVVGCTLFAAVSGSSTATLAAIGTVTVPELTKLGYDKKLVLGSICGAGTLGLMIPPSIVMIIYCVLVRESIGQLYAAGVIPGLVLSALFMGYVGLKCLLNPQLVPATMEKYSWKDRFNGLLMIAPTAFLIFIVLGSIYLGWCTPTEAAALGCAGGVVLGLINRSLKWENFVDAISETTLISGMMLFIISGAIFYATSVSYLGFGQKVMDFVVSMQVNRYVVLFIVVIIYLFLGCLMDGGSMLVLTVPIIYPAMMALGFDPIWFGVLLVITIETAQITPPVGLNLYVLSGISGEPLENLVKYSIPFFFLMLLGGLIITLFPELALWLPRQLILR